MRDPKDCAARWNAEEDPKMTITERIEKLNVARDLVAQARTDCDLPQIETILNDADTSLHWALWNLGADVTLRPELKD